MKKEYKRGLFFIGIIVIALFITLFDFSNDITKKLEMLIIGDETLTFEDISISKTKKDELTYEFIVKNNTENSLNYKLYIDAEHEGAFEYVKMKVINDGIIEFEDSLDKITNDNVFEIGNLFPFETKKYQITFESKRIKFRLFGKIDANYEIIDDIPNKITITMPNNSKTERNFTWHAKNENVGCLQIVKAKNSNKSITSFNGNSVIEVNGKVELDNFSEYVYTAKALNLKPGTEYYYRVGNKENNVWSDVGKFVTDDGNNNFSFIYLTDMQSDFNEFDISIHTAISAINKNSSAEFLLNAGDFVNDASNFEEWNGILKNNVFGNITSVTATGNHDYDLTEMGTNIFKQHFYYDINKNTNTENGIYYSFNYGNVHFTVLNTNDYGWGELSDEQLAWLKKDLKSSQKCDFRIIVMHRGVYTPGPHLYEYNDILSLTKQLTPIFAEYNVDLVLQGHDHAYGLTYPINDKFEIVETNTKNIFSREIGKKIPVMLKPNAPIYYINGAAGNKHYNTLIKIDGLYDVINNFSDNLITMEHSKLDIIYSKFQKVDTPMENDVNVALFSSIEVRGKTLLVNTYSIDNQNYKEPKLYHSFGIKK